MNESNKLTAAMRDLNDEKVLELVRQMKEGGYTQNAILACLNKGVEDVGELFESGEYFIADLIVSGMIYREALGMMTFSSGGRIDGAKGRIVIGVVEGDIHDIGKDIVVSLLRADGFEVIDLGIDVKPERFCYAIRTYQPDVVLMSGVLLTGREAMTRTMKAIEEEGLRAGTPIMLGGRCASNYLSDILKADGWSYDTMETVSFCNKAVEEKNGTQ